MAVDTREKRMSMMNFGDTSITLFEADGAVDADDRYHLLGMYSGISKSGIPAPVLDTLPTVGMYTGIAP